MRYAPTRIALVYALALVALACVSLAVPELTLVWTIGVFSLIGLMGADFLLLPAPGVLKLSRALPAESGIGAEIGMTLTMENTGARGVIGNLWDFVPDALTGETRPLLLGLGAGQRIDRVRQYRVNMRGRHVLGRAVYEAFGPLRLLRRMIRLDAPAEILALPGIELLQSNRLLLAALKDAEAGGTRARGIGRGGEFESLAPYVPGDPPNAVDWKGYARSGVLAVRRYEPERRRHVMLACDAGRLMCGLVSGRSKADLALASFARLAAAALHRGDLVGLMIFDGEVRKLIPPRAGAGQLARLIRAVTGVEAASRETAYTPAFVAMNHALGRRSLVVLATDFDNEAQGWELARSIAAIRKRHVVLVCGVRDPIYHEAVREPVKRLDDAWRQLAALTLLEERERIYADIRRGGVYAIDAEPDSLSAPLLNLYGKVVAAGVL